MHIDPASHTAMKFWPLLYHPIQTLRVGVTLFFIEFNGSRYENRRPSGTAGIGRLRPHPSNTGTAQHCTIRRTNRFDQAPLTINNSFIHVLFQPFLPQNALLWPSFKLNLLLHHFPELIFQCRSTADDHGGERKERADGEGRQSRHPLTDGTAHGQHATGPH